MMSEAFHAQWAHFPNYFAHHVVLTVAALAIGILLSLPLAALALRRPALAPPLLGLSSIIQTVPGLALLALMVPLLGRIGVVPALVALVLYSMLPILRNAITGANEVDPNVLEAAQGIGMTDRQILLRVQLPLALPVLVAGIRTAAVWTVGMATLSTPVGATSLGNFIFSGLQTQNTVAVLMGCFGAAVLAIALDGLIHLGEWAAVRRSARWAWISVGLLTISVGLACLPIFAAGFGDSKRPRATVGAKTFTEQYILAELIAIQLRQAGFDVTLRGGLGSTVAFNALSNGDLDVYVDYSGTIWANYMKRTEPASSEGVLEASRKWLADEAGIRLLGPLGFENAYAIAMHSEAARSMGISDLSDLAKQSPHLALGGDYEFFDRPEWRAVEAAYGLKFREQRSFDSALMYGAVAKGHVDAISAFSSDGRIAAYDLVVLDDPLEAFPPYDAVILLSDQAAQNPRFTEALGPLVEAISNSRMREANRRVDLDGASVEAAAAELASEMDAHLNPSAPAR